MMPAERLPSIASRAPFPQILSDMVRQPWDRWRRIGRWERSFLALSLLAVAAKVAVDAGAPSLLLDAMRLLGLAAALAALRDPATRWLDRWRLLLVVLGFWALPSVYSRVGGDGVQCYVLLRSPLLDGDLAFANDYAGLGARPVISAAGEVTTRFPIGLSLLWLPSFLLAHMASSLLSLAGGPLPADGFSPVYQSAVTAASFLYGMAALVLLERSLRRRYPPGTALGVVLALWLATPLHFYMVANPSMTHAASAFAVTLFVLSWLHARQVGTLAAWLGTGVAAGLAGWVRPQDAVLLVVPLVDLALGAESQRSRRLLSLLAGPALMAAAQGAVWVALYGPGFVGVIQDQSYVGRTEVQVVDILLSARHGLFTWTPVYLAAVFGWLLWIRSAPRTAGLFLLGFAASVLVNGAMQDWWGSEAFGQRRLLGLTPLFAWGLAETASALVRHPGAALSLILAALVAWNIQLESIYNSQVIATRTQAMSLDRLASAQVDLAYRRLLRWEGRLPQRLWALLYEYTRGIWIDEGARSLGGVIDVGVEPPDLPQVLGPGWLPPERDESVTWRRLRARRAWLRVPVRAAADYRVTVRARRDGPEAQALLRLDVNDHDCGEAALRPGWSEYVFSVPARALRPGLNDLRLMGASSADSGAPAVAVDWVRFERTRVPTGPR
jgi:hypothetical protein